MNEYLNEQSLDVYVPIELPPEDLNYRYSPSTRGFYIQALHGGNMPDDVVVVTPEEHQALFEAQAAGDEIFFDGAQVKARPQVVTDEQVAASARQQRSAMLAACDWTQLADVPEDTREAWWAYRSSLRDVPEQSGFPSTINWPKAPA